MIADRGAGKKLSAGDLPVAPFCPKIRKTFVRFIEVTYKAKKEGY